MTKLSKWTASLGVAALLSSVACQLNDLDSAPLAPDLADDTETSFSPAQTGPVSGTNAARGNSTSSRPGDAGSNLDAGSADDGNATQTSPLGDAALDAAPTPGFPILPGLEAGNLPPGNFGSTSDASIADASPVPNG